jgi:O-antigen ligase
VGEALPVFDRIAPASVAGLGSLALGLADGGFSSRAWAPTIVAFAAAVEIALLVYSRVELSRVELTGLALLAAFAGWSALSAAWSVDPTASLREAERALLFVVALLAMLLVTRLGSSYALVVGVLIATSAVSLYGLVEYLVARPPFNPVEGTLLFEPIGYANAAGILAAIGTVISCGLAVQAPSLAQSLLRALPLAVLVPTLALTESRGALAALIVALAVLVAVRFRLRRAHVIALACVLAGGAVVVVLTAAGGFYGERPTYWRVASRDYRDHPVLGSGAGTYVRAWDGTRTPSGHIAQDAHNLYLETLAELGPFGLALLAAALALPLRGIGRGGMATVAGAAYVAFLAHAAVDWDWEMPAVTLAALGCAAALLVGQREDRMVLRLSPRWRAATAAATAAAAVAVLAVAAFD